MCSPHLRYGSYASLPWEWGATQIIWNSSAWKISLFSHNCLVIQSFIHNSMDLQMFILYSGLYSNETFPFLKLLHLWLWEAPSFGPCLLLTCPIIVDKFFNTFILSITIRCSRLLLYVYYIICHFLQGFLVPFIEEWYMGAKCVLASKPFQLTEQKKFT